MCYHATYYYSQHVPAELKCKLQMQSNLLEIIQKHVGLTATTLVTKECQSLIVQELNARTQCARTCYETDIKQIYRNTLDNLPILYK